MCACHVSPHADGHCGEERRPHLAVLQFSLSFEALWLLLFRGVCFMSCVLHIQVYLSNSNAAQHCSQHGRSSSSLNCGRHALLAPCFHRIAGKECRGVACKLHGKAHLPRRPPGPAQRSTEDGHAALGPPAAGAGGPLFATSALAPSWAAATAAVALILQTVISLSQRWQHQA